MKKPLTPKQEKVLGLIRSHIEKQSESPTVEELRLKLKFKSLRTVGQYLEALERKGYIVRHRNMRRNIEILTDSVLGNTVSIPVVASVGCDDLSVFAAEEREEFLEVDRHFVENAGDIVAVRAVGESMVDAGIESGDYILVQFTDQVENGDRIAAIVNDMVVVKRLEKRNGMMVLWPESKDPKYKPIILGENYKITGKVLCVIPSPAAEMTEVVPL